MANVLYDGRTYASEGGESVLACLLRHGHEIPHSCRSGACQSCLMRATDGPIPAKAQDGLRDTLKQRGYFLACSCIPEDDMEVRLPDETAPETPAVIESLDTLSPSVLRVRLRCDEPLDYVPGQFINLVRPEGLIRSYSLASVPALEGFLELHVQRVPNGRMSGWLYDEAKPGDTIAVRGPQGNCFYTRHAPEQPLLLVGTGTGLAPLYGILRDAVDAGHTGPIHVFHGALTPEGLYYQDELHALANAHDHVHYQPGVLNGPAGNGTAVGAIDALALEQFPDLTGWRVFLCGAPEFVKPMQRKAFLAKARLGDIYSDAFLPSA